MAVHVGIGSWGDDAYVGVLYPRGLSKADRLSEYARHLEHVEVNSTYYALPRPPAVLSWIQQTPAGFTFSLKLHRAISQSPSKAAEGASIGRLLSATQPLRATKRLMCYLLVLPPRFSPERHTLEELDGLAERLGSHRLAVELRHSGWVAGKAKAATLDYFRERKLVWVAVDMPRIAGSTLMPAVDAVTNPALAYLRLHGRNSHYLEAENAAEGHHYTYAPRELSTLAARVRKLSEAADEVCVIANNHSSDFAPRAALALRALLERKPRGLTTAPKPLKARLR